MAITERVTKYGGMTSTLIAGFKEVQRVPAGRMEVPSGFEGIARKPKVHSLYNFKKNEDAGVPY